MLQSRRRKILDLYARTCNVTEGKAPRHITRLAVRYLLPKLNCYIDLWRDTLPQA